MTIGYDCVDIVRAAIPDAPPSLCDFILWNRTPFPVGSVSVRGLYRAASQFRRANDNSIRLCDHCHNPAEPHKYECRRCRAVLSKRRASTRGCK